MVRNDEPFVDFALMRRIRKAQDAGIIHPNAPIDSEYEENHLSKLERIFKALDEVEDYVSIDTLVHYRRDLLVRILEHINKEGEQQQ